MAIRPIEWFQAGQRKTREGIVEQLSPLFRSIEQQRLDHRPARRAHQVRAGEAASFGALECVGPVLPSVGWLTTQRVQVAPPFVGDRFPEYGAALVSEQTFH